MTSFAKDLFSSKKKFRKETTIKNYLPKTNNELNFAASSSSKRATTTAASADQSDNNGGLTTTDDAAAATAKNDLQKATSHITENQLGEQKTLEMAISSRSKIEKTKGKQSPPTALDNEILVEKLEKSTRLGALTNINGRGLIAEQLRTIDRMSHPEAIDRRQIGLNIFESYKSPSDIVKRQLLIEIERDTETKTNKGFENGASCLREDLENTLSKLSFSPSEISDALACFADVETEKKTISSVLDSELLQAHCFKSFAIPTFGFYNALLRKFDVKIHNFHSRGARATTNFVDLPITAIYLASLAQNCGSNLKLANISRFWFCLENFVKTASISKSKRKENVNNCQRLTQIRSQALILAKHILARQKASFENSMSLATMLQFQSASDQISFDDAADDDNDNEEMSGKKELSLPKISTTKFRRIKKTALLKISAIIQCKKIKDCTEALLSSQKAPYDLLEKNENDLSQSFNCFLCEPVAFEEKEIRKKKDFKRKLLVFKDPEIGRLNVNRLMPIDTVAEAITHCANYHGIGARFGGSGGKSDPKIRTENLEFNRQQSSLTIANRIKSKPDHHNLPLACLICQSTEKWENAMACCLLCAKDHFKLLHQGKDIFCQALETVRNSYANNHNILSFAEAVLDIRCIICLKVFVSSQKRDRHQNDTCLISSMLQSRCYGLPLEPSVLDFSQNGDYEKTFLKGQLQKLAQCIKLETRGTQILEDDDDSTKQNGKKGGRQSEIDSLTREIDNSLTQEAGCGAAGATQTSSDSDTEAACSDNVTSSDPLTKFLIREGLRTNIFDLKKPSKKKTTKSSRQETDKKAKK